LAPVCDVDLGDEDQDGYDDEEQEGDEDALCPIT